MCKVCAQTLPPLPLQNGKTPQKTITRFSYVFIAQAGMHHSPFLSVFWLFVYFRTSMECVYWFNSMVVDWMEASLVN